MSLLGYDDRCGCKRLEGRWVELAFAFLCIESELYRGIFNTVTNHVLEGGMYLKELVGDECYSFIRRELCQWN